MNIAEGNGKLPSPDRQRYLRIALGSAVECAAPLDVLLACNAIEAETTQMGKGLLVRIVAMLTKMTSRSMRVRETSEYAYAYAYDDQETRQQASRAVADKLRRID